MKRLQKGFTLIELMIVIAIIAILAAILIPNFLHARAESQTAACEGNEKQLATALEEYAVDFSGAYPATFAALQAVGPNTYISNVPKEPVNGGVYTLSLVAVNCPAPVVGASFYEIDDPGAVHDPTVKIANAPLGKQGVAYCSGSGIIGF